MSWQQMLPILRSRIISTTVMIPLQLPPGFIKIQSHRRSRLHVIPERRLLFLVAVIAFSHRYPVIQPQDRLEFPLSDRKVFGQTFTFLSMSSIGTTQFVSSSVSQ